MKAVDKTSGWRVMAGSQRGCCFGNFANKGDGVPPDPPSNRLLVLEVLMILFLKMLAHLQKSGLVLLFVQFDQS